MKRTEEEITQERAEAWVGDAVLALFVRQWILAETGKIDGQAFIRFTTNDFLRAFGNPTAVEARIGRLYAAEGLELAFTHIRQDILPHFIIREKVRIRKGR